MSIEAKFELYGTWIKSGPIIFSHKVSEFHSQAEEFQNAMKNNTEIVKEETPDLDISQFTEIASNLQAQISVLKSDITEIKEQFASINSNENVNKQASDDTDSLILEDDTISDFDNLEHILKDNENNLLDLPILSHTEEMEDISDNKIVLATPIQNKEIEISEEIKEDIKTVLTYLDQLLESLPESKIEEFAHSPEFLTYKKLFQQFQMI